MGETEADLKSSRVRHIKSPVSKPHSLLTGSENVLPLAQPVLPRAEQRNLMLFFSPLKNYWIWVVLSCNEQVSVPKIMLLFLGFFPPRPRTASCLRMLFRVQGEKSMESTSESIDLRNKSQISPAGRIPDYLLIKGEILLYWPFR